MDIKTLLFSFKGRINRAKYWLAAVIYIAATLLVIGIAIAAATVSAILFWVAGALYLVVVVSGVAVGIKRLHDRDKSGWWLLLFYCLPAILSSAAETTELSGGKLLLTGASVAITIWALVELGFLRGTTGANRYGPDPLPL